MSQLPIRYLKDARRWIAIKLPIERWDADELKSVEAELKNWLKQVEGELERRKFE